MCGIIKFKCKNFVRTDIISVWFNCSIIFEHIEEKSSYIDDDETQEDTDIIIFYVCLCAVPTSLNIYLINIISGIGLLSCPLGCPIIWLLMTPYDA